MKQLTTTQNAIFLLGALLMVVGSGATVLMQQWAPAVFCIGAVAYVSMQLLQRYEGRNIVIRRLRRMLFVSDLLFLIAGLLMLANQAGTLGLDFLFYLKYVHNNWVVALLIAALLQLYATHRISHELEKEAKKR